jgi:outer membrane protein with beta-barrel domain
MDQLRRAELSSKHSGARSLAVALAILLLSAPVPVAAQNERMFAGALYGVSALSADARSEIIGSTAAVSLYEPENGPALNVFAGIHIAQYFSVQADWMWNSNDLTLTSSFSTPQAGAFYEQHRDSDQHAVVLDGLIYFRRLDSTIRPYLGTGLSVLHFSSNEITASAAQGLPAPSGRMASTHIGLRSHVGIDFKLSRRLTFRYSFSETISANPISPALTPQGRRGLMNFQNLFGFVGLF